MSAYGWSEEYVRLELTGAKGWVYYNWAVENEQGMFGERLVRTSPGYVKQERIRLTQAQ